MLYDLRAVQPRPPSGAIPVEMIESYLTSASITLVFTTSNGVVMPPAIAPDTAPARPDLKAVKVPSGGASRF